MLRISPHKIGTIGFDQLQNTATCRDLNPLNATSTKWPKADDDLFECVWPFCGVGAERAKHENKPQYEKIKDEDNEKSIRVLSEISL